MDDSEKIAEIEKILQTNNLKQSFNLLGFALAIYDDDNRDLYLLEVVRWLIKNEIWQKAYGTAQMMAESYEKSEALQTVADYLASIGHLEKAFSVFDDAKHAAQSENLSEWQQAELLHKIAKSLKKIKAFFKADEVWEKAVATAQKGQLSTNLQNSLDSSSVLAEIAEYFASDEKIEKALATAQNIKNIDKKDHILLCIAEHSQTIKRVA